MNKNYLIISLLTFFLLNSCFQDNNNSELDKGKLRCYFFFIPDCPASINNINKLNVLHERYENEVKFIGILSEPYYNKKNLDSIVNLHSIRFKVIIDDSLLIAKKHGATVTPECFLYNNKNLIYSGALDDYYYSTGKHKSHTKENYLDKAINSFIMGSEIELKHTPAYGCRIELNYFQ